MIPPTKVRRPTADEAAIPLGSFPRCRAVETTVGWVCTLGHGHDGNHIAHTGTASIGYEVVAVWHEGQA